MEWFSFHGKDRDEIGRGAKSLGLAAVVRAEAVRCMSRSLQIWSCRAVVVNAAPTIENAETSSDGKP